jgi:hypothetical protein
MRERRVGKHRAPHPNWRPEWPPGSVVLGRTARGKFIWIGPDQRKLGMLLLGIPNQGKSKLMEGMWRQDALSLSGITCSSVFACPHGTSYNANLDWAVTYGLDRRLPLRLLDLSDPDFIFKINPARRREGIDPAVVAQATRDAILKGSWGKSGVDPATQPQITEALDVVFTTIAEFGAAFADAAALLEHDDSTHFREYAAQNSANPLVRSFWRKVIDARPRERELLVGGAERRLHKFLLPDRARRMLDEANNVINWRQVMDDGEIVLLNLSYDDRGVVSEDQATTIGTLIMHDLFLACRGRNPDALTTYVYWDEVHRFATDAAARFFTESRKYKVHPIFAMQLYDQLEETSPFIKGAIMSSRNQVFFGGLPPTNARIAAEFAFRGQLDLQKVKHRFDKPVMIDQVPKWLRSESVSRGTAHATGRSESRGGSEATSESTTESRSTTRSESDTASESETLSDSESRTEGYAASSTSAASQSGSWSQSDTRSASRAQATDEVGDAIGGPTLTDGVSTTSGMSGSYGASDATGRSSSASSSRTRGAAHTTGIARTTGRAETEGTAVTTGTTRGTNWSRGTSTTETVSRQSMHGRSQTLRSVLKIMPTQSYTLEELLFTTAAQIANLDQGEAVVKIGRRPAEKVRTVFVNSGWARPEQIARATARLAAQTPYVTPARQEGEDDVKRLKLSAPDAKAMLSPDPDQPKLLAPPPLKDEGWG